MVSPASEAWTTLHDLALLYLFLAHAADAELDVSEKEAMQRCLMNWRPIGEETPTIEHVIDEAMLTYMGAHSKDMLNTTMVSLKEAMDPEMRVAILNDLADVASADGVLAPGEVAFIQDLARFWEVQGEIQRSISPSDSTQT